MMQIDTQKEKVTYINKRPRKKLSKLQKYRKKAEKHGILELARKREVFGSFWNQIKENFA